MSFLAAAEVVLKASKRPMTAREIVDHAMERGLIESRGKTPEATLSAALYRAIKDDADCRIRRDYQPGIHRAARDSVRWSYVR